MAAAHSPPTNANSSTENDLFFLESEKSQRPKRRHSITNCQDDYDQERNGNRQHRNNSRSFRNQAISPEHGGHIKMCSNFENRNSQPEDPSKYSLDNHNVPHCSFENFDQRENPSNSFDRNESFQNHNNLNDLINLRKKLDFQERKVLENSEPRSLPYLSSKGQSQRNESKSKTGNLDRKLLNESEKAVILDNHSVLDFDNKNWISKKQERPKSLTLDYRYLKKAKHPDDYVDSRRFFERSDQFENRFFNHDLSSLQIKNMYSDFGHNINNKIENLKANNLQREERIDQLSENNFESDEDLKHSQNNLRGIDYNSNSNELNNSNENVYFKEFGKNKNDRKNSEESSKFKRDISEKFDHIHDVHSKSEEFFRSPNNKCSNHKSEEFSRNYNSKDTYLESDQKNLIDNHENEQDDHKELYQNLNYHQEFLSEEYCNNTENHRPIENDQLGLYENIEILIKQPRNEGDDYHNLNCDCDCCHPNNYKKLDCCHAEKEKKFNLLDNSEEDQESLDCFKEDEIKHQFKNLDDQKLESPVKDWRKYYNDESSRKLPQSPIKDDRIYQCGECSKEFNSENKENQCFCLSKGKAGDDILQHQELELFGNIDSYNECQLKKSQENMLKPVKEEHVKCGINKDELYKNSNCYDKYGTDCNNCSSFVRDEISEPSKNVCSKAFKNELENIDDAKFHSKSLEEFCFKSKLDFDKEVVSKHPQSFLESETGNISNYPEANDLFYVDEKTKSSHHLKNQRPVSVGSFLQNPSHSNDDIRFEFLDGDSNMCVSLDDSQKVDLINKSNPMNSIQFNKPEDDIRFDTNLQRDDENDVLIDMISPNIQNPLDHRVDVISSPNNSIRDEDEFNQPDNQILFNRTDNLRLIQKDDGAYCNTFFDDENVFSNRPSSSKTSNLIELSKCTSKKGNTFVDGDSGFETEYLGNDSENEAMDVLLQLDEVLNECLKETGDFVNTNHDEYRLSRKISLEELEGKNKGLHDGLLVEKQVDSKEMESLQNIEVEMNLKDYESDDEVNILSRRISLKDVKNCNSERFEGDNSSLPNFLKDDGGESNSKENKKSNDDADDENNQLSRVVKMQELEGRAKIEVMQYCLSSSNFEKPSKHGDDKEPDVDTTEGCSGIIRDDITIEECLHDLDEYLRAFDDDSCSGMSTANVAAGKSYCNLGYINSELDKTESDTPQRPLSSCGSRAGALTRNHAYRATIGAIKCGGGEERAMVLHRSDNPSARRTSAADGDEVIDWSWLNDVEGANSVEIVENHRPSTSVVVEDSMATGDAKRPMWLRTSMRRLQPLPLPTNVDNADHAPATSSAMDNLTPAEANFAMGNSRPISAPSRLPSVQRSRSRDRASQNPAGRARSSSASSRSRRPRSLSSSVSSVVSSVDSTPTCTPTPAQTYNTNTTEEANNNINNVRRTCERPTRNNDMPEAESPLGQWPHSLSSTLAYIGCTLGIFNISRFAILSVHFGANFIFQFLIITFFIGLPIFTLQLCLGQQLGAGVIDMWKISPMFQGVGVSLLFFQALTGIYSIIGTSWMFVYFRDSFVTKMERYRWAEPFAYYRNDIQPPINGSYKLTETIPDYLSGIVFQRHHLVSGNMYGTIKFQPAFNLAVVWMIVFVSLGKGLRSYGKVIYVFTLLPIFGMFVLCAKLLGMMPPELINNVFPETSWNEFFINPRSWLAACQEAFLTWGMLGAAVMQIASHNKNKHLLQRDSSLIAVITVTILLLTAFLANTCVQILKVNGFSYQPDSFEKLSTYMFMRHKSDPLPPNLASTPVKYMVHNSFIVGDRINRPGYDSASESGYQVLRFATELIPATFAILGTDQVSPFWTVLFYFILILFGIAQQLAIWHCVITGIMAINAKVLKSWETTITFFSCACGFILGLPMTTEFGIYVVYFMDLAIGGIWWLILILLLQIIAVFMVRGRPYSGDTLVTVLFHSNNYKCLLSWAPALLSFTWNVVLPVVLMVWCIAFFKNGNFREFFIWHHGLTLEYWPLWARQIGALLQLLPVLAVPFIAVIQSYRYLNNGPNDILDRIQLLYRPPIGEHMDDLAIQEAAAAMNNNTTSPTTNIVAEDPPPKYTPPPSYTTATGARIAKLLRQSIRRSVRRIANVLGESSGTRSRNAPTTSQAQEPPPPDYNAVLVEMNQNQRDISINIPDRNNTIQRELATIATSSTGLTAADVACILRSSFRRSTLRTLRRNNAGTDQSMSSLSAENLIDSAAPIGETSLVLGLTSDSDNKDGNNTSSVI